MSKSPSPQSGFSTRELADGSRLRVARGCEAVRLLDARWDALLREQRWPNPTLASQWLRDVVDFDAREPLTITVESGGELRAAGAFGLAPHLEWGAALEANFLGTPRPVLTPDLLVAEGAGTAVDHLLGAVYEHAEIIRILTPAGGHAANALRRRAPWLREHGRPSWRECPVPPTNLHRRQREIRYEIRRATRRGAKIETLVHAEPAAVARALERLFVIHRERWAGRNDISCFSSTEAERAWHRRAVENLAQLGDVRIAEVIEDGRLVGSDLILLAGRGALCHTTAMRTGGLMRSPGNASLLLGVEAAEESGVERIGFGRGEGAHKTRYAPEGLAVSMLSAAPTARDQLRLRRRRRAQRKLRAGLQTLRHALTRSSR